MTSGQNIVPGSFTDTRLYDLAAAAPLMLLYAFGIVVSVTNTAHALAAWPPSTFWQILITVALNLVTIAFGGLQMVLFCVRRLPTARAAGLWPRLTAIVGSNAQMLILLVPLRREGAMISVVSPVLVTIGLAASLIVLANLGRSFSILPQARGLVTKGPYHWVRHPLYLAEMITSLGIVLRFAEPWAAAVFVISTAIQLLRMHYEEQVMLQTFTEYASYSRRTWRIIPWVF